LNLKYNELLLTFGINFNLRRYNEAWIKPGIAAAARTTSEFLVQLGDGGWGVFLVAGGLSLVGRCRLAPG